MIYDHIESFALYQGTSCILPAEALLASIEIKSVLTRQELEKCLRAASSLKKLRPFKRRIAPVLGEGAPADGHARIFHAIFAYDSDLKAEGWMEAELARLTEVGMSCNIDVREIDRLYVANRGMINNVNSIAFSGKPKKKLA